jgi:hypothetical protein
MVPNPSRPCPPVSPSYEREEPKPSVLNNEWEDEDVPSAFTGTSFQTRQAADDPFNQNCTWVAELVSYGSSVSVNTNLSAVHFVTPS